MSQNDSEYRIKKKEKSKSSFESETRMENILSLGIYNPNQSNFIKVAPEHQSQYKWARLLYIGNLPDSFQEHDLKSYLYASLQKAAGLLEAGSPVSLLDPES